MIRAALFYVAVAVALTWPLARLLPIAVAHPGDPLITSWILAWDVHAFANAPLDVYHANIFYPAKYTLALSENLFGLWPLAAIVSLFASPLAVQNVLLILGYAFSAFGMYVLARLVGAGTLPAIAAGLVYGFCPWRFVHIAHLQHAWGGWMPLLLAAVISYDRKPSRRTFAFIVIAAVMNGLTNLHYLVFGMTAAIVAVLVLRNAKAAVALFVAAVILAGVLWPYARVQRHNADEARTYSASISDWIRDKREEPERRVFPGWVAIAGAAVALIRRRFERWQILALLLVVIGVAFSLGMHNPIYEWLFEHAPGLSGIRAPARWAALAYLGMALLIAAALHERRIVSAVVGILAIAQVFSAPLRWYLMPPEPAPVHQWLKSQNPHGGTLELPIGVDNRDFYYLRGAATHLKPIFNGVSGDTTPIHRELTATFSAPRISDGAIARLKELGASYVIVHMDAFDVRHHEVRRWLREALTRGELAYVGRFEDAMIGDYVFTLDGPGKEPDDALKSLIDYGPMPFNERPFGMIQSMSTSGSFDISGWALSSRGIRRVRLWFANKKCYLDAALSADDELQRSFPRYSTATARFQVALPKPPCGGRENDVLVEILDHGGEVTTLPHVWFQWEEQR